jgi:hypothetical protein
MAGDAYRYPIHEYLTVDATDEEAVAYEQTLLRLVSEWIEAEGGEAHGHSGVLLSVRLEGSRPDTRIIFRYRSHAGGEYEADWSVWDEDGLNSAGD